MASSVPLQIAETVQTAHINRHPSPAHDLNPSTAASRKEPVVLEEKKKQARQVSRFPDEGIYGDEEEEEDEENVPFSILRPKPRRTHLPPIPDLRYEQSYLHSIRNADTWWKVAWITTRDQVGILLVSMRPWHGRYVAGRLRVALTEQQVMMPMVQGVVYNLAICGWQHWNRNAQLSGSSAGARIRRWWYGVNNWPLPKEKYKAKIW